MSKLKVFITILSFFSLPAMVRAAEQEKTPLNAQWKMSLLGTDSRNEMSQSHLVNFRFDLNVDYWVSPELFFDLSPRMQLQSGSTQSLDESQQANNKLLLNQAALQWMAFQNMLISAGALDQSRLHSSILFGEFAFPALRATYAIQNDISTKFVLENAIPTSASLATNTSQLEPTPSFNQAQLQLNWEPQKFRYWKNSFGYFQFHNLPTVVATNSALNGNTVDRYSDTESVFRYQYQGIEAQTDLRMPSLISRFDMILSAAYVQNQAAPKGLNQGLTLGLGGAYRLSGKSELEIRSNYFRIEPDTSVADFASDDNYNTNRVGYRTDILLNVRNKYKIGLRYSEAQPLYVNPAQSEEKSIKIKLETNYASI